MFKMSTCSFADARGAGNLPIIVLLALLGLLALGPFSDSATGLVEVLGGVLGP